MSKCVTCERELNTGNCGEDGYCRYCWSDQQKIRNSEPIVVNRAVFPHPVCRTCLHWEKYVECPQLSKQLTGVDTTGMPTTVHVLPRHPATFGCSLHEEKT